MRGVVGCLLDGCESARLRGAAEAALERVGGRAGKRWPPRRPAAQKELALSLFPLLHVLMFKRQQLGGETGSQLVARLRGGLHRWAPVSAR